MLEAVTSSRLSQLLSHCMANRCDRHEEDLFMSAGDAWAAQHAHRPYLDHYNGCVGGALVAEPDEVPGHVGKICVHVGLHNR